jgi:hypothetical protein
MPTSGFEVRGHIVRQRSPGFASVHFEVDRRAQQFAVVRQRPPMFAGVAVTAAVKVPALQIHRRRPQFGHAPGRPPSTTASAV